MLVPLKSCLGATNRCLLLTRCGAGEWPALRRRSFSGQKIWLIFNLSLSKTCGLGESINDLMCASSFIAIIHCSVTWSQISTQNICYFLVKILYLYRCRTEVEFQQQSGRVDQCTDNMDTSKPLHSNGKSFCFLQIITRVIEYKEKIQKNITLQIGNIALWSYSTNSYITCRCSNVPCLD